MEEHQREYIKNEVGGLRSEIHIIQANIENTEKIALFTSGAIWALIATLSWNSIVSLIAWMPVIITVVFYFKKMMLVKTLDQVAKHILLVENRMELPEELGWQSFWNKNKANSSVKGYLAWWGYVYWLLLCAGNVWIALYFPFEQVIKK